MRAKETESLNVCPTCGGIADHLGLRDYSRWLFDVLPGKAGGSDLDCVVERKGNFLLFEFKPTKYVPRGQSIMFDALTEQGWTIYVVVDRDLEKLQVQRWGTAAWHIMSVADLTHLAQEWYAWADEGEAY